MPSTPLRADARRNRARLLDAAREVFAEAGLDASLEEIARRAGVRVGTLYHHFGNRTALVDAAIAPRVEAWVERVEEALAHPDPWEGLVEHLTLLAEWQTADRGFTEVCVRTLPADSATERAKARGHACYAELIARAQAAGALRPDVSPADVGLLVWAAVRATEGVRALAPDAWRRHLGVLLDGLRADRATPLPGGALDPATVRAAMTFP
ncbi:transcriptional regulator, TetR family [Pseudonocardia thermophila]|uniref:Transcriptional regulator, TetR family n=1 Tax=Pseudonocardia thermophila TaxID=1848 RepID=A0A1M6TNB7_PSETH|nr:TetR/AcrR family transcriptional regulator [Pseudonocardia thermophila]SHK58403.1 transcriptional regulator, TetR family [Pseudonocardia thermophila]